MERTSGLLGIGLLAAGMVSAQTLIVSNNFDGVDNDIGPAFQQLGNGGGGGSADPANGMVFSGGTAVSGAWGLNNISLVDLSSSSSFTVEWVVDTFSTSNTLDAINYNGFFFGVVAGTSATATDGGALFNNNPAAIGIHLFEDTTAYAGPMNILQDPEGGATAGIAQTSLGVPAPDLASLQDGFTLSFTLNIDNTWSAFSMGLSTDFNTSGTLNTANAASPIFADLISGGVGVYSSIQGENVGYTLGEATLTAVEAGDLLLPLIDTSVTSGYIPLEVVFDGSGSISSGTINNYFWDFGDGNTADSVMASNTYTATNAYTAWLIVMDDQGLVASNSVVITAELEPSIAVASATPIYGEVPLEVVFDGSGSTPPAGGSITNYVWTFGDGNMGSGVMVTNNYTTNGTFTATLEVTDTNGQTASDTVTITVTEVLQIDITTQVDGTGATAAFPVSFIPPSTDDLANTNQASFLSVVGTGLQGGTVAEDLVNGTVPAVANEGSDRAAIINASTVTINFDTSINTLGYDITNINTYAGWDSGGFGRANQDYTVTVTFMDDTTETIYTATPDEASGLEPNDTPNSWTAVYISGKNGAVLASGVKTITFSDFDDYRGGSSTVQFREIDVLGSPTALTSIGDVAIEVSGDQVVLSWDTGTDLDVWTNANLVYPDWGVIQSGVSSPATIDIGSEAQLYYELRK